MSAIDNRIELTDLLRDHPAERRDDESRYRPAQGAARTGQISNRPPQLTLDFAPRVRLHRRWLACCVILAGLCMPWDTRAQVTNNQAIGALQATGEVYLNGMRAAGQQTIYPGDVVRTGPDGAAALTIPGTGMVTVAAQTEVSFRTDAYLAKLKEGTVGIHMSDTEAGIEIESVNFLAFVPLHASETAGTITVGADGGGRVECLAGSIGVTALQNAGALFLKPGQSAAIAANGQLGAIETSTQGQPAPAPEQPSAPPIRPVKKSRAGYYILGAAGAGGVAAALAALSHGGNSQPVSPSKP